MYNQYLNTEKTINQPFYSHYFLFYEEILKDENIKDAILNEDNKIS
jgi:hypothetical protein